MFSGGVDTHSGDGVHCQSGRGGRMRGMLLTGETLLVRIILFLGWGGDDTIACADDAPWRCTGREASKASLTGWMIGVSQSRASRDS